MCDDIIRVKKVDVAIITTDQNTTSRNIIESESRVNAAQPLLRKLKVKNKHDKWHTTKTEGVQQLKNTKIFAESIVDTIIMHCHSEEACKYFLGNFDEAIGAKFEAFFRPMQEKFDSAEWEEVSATVESMNKFAIEKFYLGHHKRQSLRP